MERSFKEYISKRFYDTFFDAVKNHIEENLDSLDLRSNSVENVDEAELSDVTVKQIGIDDLEGMKVAVDVVVEAEIDIYERDRHNDNSDTCNQWFMLSCAADLSCNLNGFTIETINIYNRFNKHNKPLSDSLVPYINASRLEETATEILKDYYPEALSGDAILEPCELAKRLGLKIETHQITSDFSVFGQIFFADCDTEVYDSAENKMVMRHIDAKTIVVDPTAFLLRNLGTVNNTIVHECVHWIKHRKAFELERLYNDKATQIKCEVIGGIKDESVRSASDWMEWQANSLAPKLQMPLIAFKIAADKYMHQYITDNGPSPGVDAMPFVIDTLMTEFCVSRCAAKIRLIEAGYDEAIGAFTYIDGHYVKPHAYKKGALKKNETYCIGLDDAAVISFSNMHFREQVDKGLYTYVDSHFCINDPKYVTTDVSGTVVMTEYGRLHADECCLAFTLKVKAKNKYGEEFYKECVLFRDANSGIEFITEFSEEINGNVMAEANAVIKRSNELQKTISEMPMSFGDALAYLMKWADVTVESLAEKSYMDTKMIQRMRNGPDYPKSIESVIAVCIGMQLPPELSNALLSKSGFSLRIFDKQEHILYKFFLDSYYTHTISECNELLTSKGFSVLTGKE